MSKIAFIGGGNMSSCIFNGIIKTRPSFDSIMVSGPHLEKLEHFKQSGTTITTDNVAATRESEVIFLGVKPQMLTTVLNELAAAEIDFKHKLVVSMVAGYLCTSIAKIIGSPRIIRIMPNTPSKLGLGVVGIYYAAETSAADRDLCKDLLKGLGSIIETQNEEGINVIGCLGGSTPAFLYRFLEALIAETVARGFTEEAARKMIQQMALGTASMCIANPDTPISQMREAVTSKGGTTIEGLKKMSEYHFEEMMSAVVKASMDRTHEFERMFS